MSSLTSVTADTVQQLIPKAHDTVKLFKSGLITLHCHFCTLVLHLLSRLEGWQAVKPLLKGSSRLNRKAEIIILL